VRERHARLHKRARAARAARTRSRVATLTNLSFRRPRPPPPPSSSKCITTIQGLDEDLDLRRIMKHMKKVFNTNGSITEDDEMGEIIQLQGDQRQNVKEWLLAQEVVTQQELERIVIHGF
jgi:translation initiation factor SUI1